MLRILTSFWALPSPESWPIQNSGPIKQKNEPDFKWEHIHRNLNHKYEIMTPL